MGEKRFGELIKANDSSKELEKLGRSQLSQTRIQDEFASALSTRQVHPCSYSEYGTKYHVSH